MAHKTFISYKYSESRKLRDDIINALGDDAKYYNGENGFSPNMSDDTDETIWNYLKDMIWGTSVTIVIISPNMTKSDWIESEIEYSLRKVSRDGTQSQRNGVVGVIKKVDSGYSWFKGIHTNDDGCKVITYDESKVFDVIKNNRRNQMPKEYSCKECKTIDSLKGSYISYVEEETFLKDPSRYIENAFEKSPDDCDGYEIKLSS